MYIGFAISPAAVRTAREIDRLEKQAKEPRDIVSQVNEAARKHRLLAYCLIGFFVLTMVLHFVNQAIQLLKTLGAVQ